MDATGKLALNGFDEQESRLLVGYLERIIKKMESCSAFGSSRLQTVLVKDREDAV